MITESITMVSPPAAIRIGVRPANTGCRPRPALPPAKRPSLAEYHNSRIRPDKSPGERRRANTKTPSLVPVAATRGTNSPLARARLLLLTAHRLDEDPRHLRARELGRRELPGA